VLAFAAEYTNEDIAFRITVFYLESIGHRVVVGRFAEHGPDGGPLTRFITLFSIWGSVKGFNFASRHLKQCSEWSGQPPF
jgi:hypothetical protein